jgi:hypothetical protein
MPEVFEPERLRQIIGELGRQLAPIAQDPRLKEVRHTGVKKGSEQFF